MLESWCLVLILIKSKIKCVQVQITFFQRFKCTHCRKLCKILMNNQMKHLAISLFLSVTWYMFVWFFMIHLKREYEKSNNSGGWMPTWKETICKFIEYLTTIESHNGLRTNSVNIAFIFHCLLSNCLSYKNNNLYAIATQNTTFNITIGSLY